MEALLPIIGALISGGGMSAATAALSSLSLTQWITIGIEVAAAAPKIKAAYSALHPAIATFIGDLEKNLGAGMDKHMASARAYSTMAEWFAANSEAAIRVEQSMEDRQPA
jgi:hypothetical protein